MIEIIRRPKREDIARLIRRKAFPSIGYVEIKTSKRIACCRGVCKRTTKNPKADKWIYFERAPEKVRDWEGKYMCRPCWNELKRFLQTNVAQRSDRTVKLDDRRCSVVSA